MIYDLGLWNVKVPQRVLRKFNFGCSVLPFCETEIRKKRKNEKTKKLGLPFYFTRVLLGRHFTTTTLQLPFYNYHFTTTILQLPFYNYHFTTTILQLNSLYNSIHFTTPKKINADTVLHYHILIIWSIMHYFGIDMKCVI